MSNALNVPITSTLGDTGLDEVITKIQRSMGYQPWNQFSLGRIKPQPKKGSSLPEPWIFDDQTREYYKAYPNDTLNSFSCVYAHDDEKYDQMGVFAQRTLSIIVSVNFESISYSRPTLEELKQSTINSLQDLYCVQSVNKSVDQTTSGANGVYPGFDVSGFDLKYMTYPFGAFRIEITAHWTNTNPCY